MGDITIMGKKKFEGRGAITAYTTPEALAAKVEEYFTYCFREQYSERHGRNVIVTVTPPTMSGLARYLGFRSRFELMTYKNKSNELYESVLDDARLRIEEYLETELIRRKGDTRGIIFSLKNNARWEETTKTQLTGEDDKPLVFGWADNAADVIDVDKTPEEKELEEMKTKLLALDEPVPVLSEEESEALRALAEEKAAEEARERERRERQEKEVDWDMVDGFRGGF